MKEAGTGHHVPDPGDKARIAELVEEAQMILDLTRKKGWYLLFDPVRRSAAQAVQGLLVEEDPVEICKHQAHLEACRNQIAKLRRPFEELKRRIPDHPLAIQGLPFADEFDLTLACGLIHPEGVEAMIQKGRRPKPDPFFLRLLRSVPGADLQDPVERDSNLKTVDRWERPAAKKRKDQTPKDDHPWRLKSVAKQRPRPADDSWIGEDR